MEETLIGDSVFEGTVMLVVVPVVEEAYSVVDTQLTLAVVDHLETISLAVDNDIPVTLATADEPTGGMLIVDEDVGDIEDLLVTERLLGPDMDDEATTILVDAKVEFAAIERTTGPEVVTLTDGITVVEESGKPDVDDVDILGLRLNVDCDVLLTDSVGLCETMTTDDVESDDNDG